MVTLADININAEHIKPAFLDITTENESGVITVSVLELGLSDSAEVAIYDRRTRRLVQIARSSSDGLLVFTGLNKGREYYLHAIHDERKFNAVTQDMIPGNYDELKTKGLL